MYVSIPEYMRTHVPRHALFFFFFCQLPGEKVHARRPEHLEGAGQETTRHEAPVVLAKSADDGRKWERRTNVESLTERFFAAKGGSHVSQRQATAANVVHGTSLLVIVIDPRFFPTRSRGFSAYSTPTAARHRRFQRTATNDNNKFDARTIATRGEDG